MLLSFAAGYMLKDGKTRVYDSEVEREEGVNPVTQPARVEVWPGKASTPPAFSDLLDQPDVFSVLHMAFNTAAAANVDTARDYAAQALALNDELLAFAIAYVFVERINVIDASVAMRFVESLPVSQNRQRLLLSIQNTWERDDSDAAQQYSNQWMQQQKIIQPAGGDVSGAAIVNGVLAARSAGTNLRVDKGLELRRQIQADPQGTIEALLELSDTRDDRDKLRSAVGILASENPELALQMLDDYPEAIGRFRRTVLTTVAQKDPAAIVDRAKTYATATGDIVPLMTAVSGFIETDLEAAFQLLDSLPSSSQSQIVLNVAGDLLTKDPETGIAWMLEQKSASMYLPFAMSMAGEPARAAAERTFADMPAGSARDFMLRAIAEGRGQEDPAAAVEWLDEYRAEKGYHAALNQVVSQWAAINPTAVADYIENNPADSVQTLKTLARGWASQEPEDALVWAQGLADAEQRDGALSEVIVTMSWEYPDKAKSLYATLPDGPAKYRVGSQIALRDMHRTGVSRRQAMEALGLPPEYIENFLVLVYE